MIEKRWHSTTRNTATLLSSFFMYHSAHENTIAAYSSSLDAFKRTCLYKLGLWYTVTKTDLQALIKNNLWLSFWRAVLCLLTGGQDLISAALQDGLKSHGTKFEKCLCIFSQSLMFTCWTMMWAPAWIIAVWTIWRQFCLKNCTTLLKIMFWWFHEESLTSIPFHCTKSSLQWKNKLFRVFKYYTH